MKKNLIIFLSLLTVAGSTINISLAANQIDGTIYPVIIESNWDTEIVQIDPNRYEPKPFICHLKTDYQGAGGVEVRMKFTNGNGEYHKQVVKYNENSSISSQGFSFYGQPFKQPAMVLFNEGCSKYLDGDKCNNDEGYRPVIYASCKYT